MAREKTRAGFEPVRDSYRNGHFTRYVDKATGENISRRQYIKRSENIKSLEQKARQFAEFREETGKRQPMRRYNKIVEQYKLTHGKDAKVKGDSPEAKHFQKLYADLKKPRKGMQGNLRRLKVLRDLGVITQKEHDDSAAKVMSHYLD